MKAITKTFIVLIIIAACVTGVIFFKDFKEKRRIAEIKKGWYIEITHYEPINIRSENNIQSDILGKADIGSIYKVLDADATSSNTLYWYKVEYEGKEAWIASNKKKPWVKDVNNPIDIVTPSVKFESNVYHVATIDDINYDHLEVVEDSDDYEITHVVYHEVKDSEFTGKVDQYWILYTIEDATGKKSSKMQKIEFDVRPDESRVLDFADYQINF